MIRARMYLHEVTWDEITRDRLKSHETILNHLR